MEMKPGATLNCKLVGLVRMKNFWLEVFKAMLSERESLDSRILLEVYPS